MITYLYWFTVLAASLLVFWLLTRFLKWKIGAATALLIIFVGWAAYHFRYEQLFVKNYGGVMSLEVPEGHMHLSLTWKDDHLWIESYDPEKNTCYFSEVSKGHILEGRVTIKNCNPVLLNKFSKP